MEQCRWGDPRVPARVWARFVIDPTTRCWRWTGKPNREGYGRVQVAGRLWRVHRYMYSTLVRELAADEVPDHRCHTDDPACYDSWACPHRLCGNPAHLEPVTGAENSARQHSPYAAREACPAGHPYDEENTRWYRGARYCARCQADTGAERSATYRARHPHRVQAAQSRYRETHRDKLSDAAHVWHAAHRDDVARRHRAWAEANREHRREYMREWRARRRAAS